MIFAYSTNAFVRFSLFESLEKIAGLGFRGVEIMGDISLELYPYVDTPESAGRESLYYLRPIFRIRVKRVDAEGKVKKTLTPQRIRNMARNLPGSVDG